MTFFYGMPLLYFEIYDAFLAPSSWHLASHGSPLQILMLGVGGLTKGW